MVVALVSIRWALIVWNSIYQQYYLAHAFIETLTSGSSPYTVYWFTKFYFLRCFSKTIHSIIKINIVLEFLNKSLFYDTSLDVFIFNFFHLIQLLIRFGSYHSNHIYLYIYHRMLMLYHALFLILSTIHSWSRELVRTALIVVLPASVTWADNCGKKTPSTPKNRGWKLVEYLNSW